MSIVSLILLSCCSQSLIRSILYSVDGFSHLCVSFHTTLVSYFIASLQSSKGLCITSAKIVPAWYLSARSRDHKEGATLGSKLAATPPSLSAPCSPFNPAQRGPAISVMLISWLEWLEIEINIDWQNNFFLFLFPFLVITQLVNYFCHSSSHLRAVNLSFLKYAIR